MAAGQNQWDHFGVGAPPILVYFSGDWDVHCGLTGLLTHGQMDNQPCLKPPIGAWFAPGGLPVPCVPALPAGRGTGAVHGCGASPGQSKPGGGLGRVSLVGTPPQKGSNHKHGSLKDTFCNHVKHGFSTPK